MQFYLLEREIKKFIEKCQLTDSIDTKWCRLIRIKFENSIWKACVTIRNESPTRSNVNYIYRCACIKSYASQNEEKRRGKRYKKRRTETTFQFKWYSHWPWVSCIVVFVVYVLTFFFISGTVHFGELLCECTTIIKCIPSGSSEVW